MSIKHLIWQVIAFVTHGLQVKPTNHSIRLVYLQFGYILIFSINDYPQNGVHCRGKWQRLESGD